MQSEVHGDSGVKWNRYPKPDMLHFDDRFVLRQSIVPQPRGLASARPRPLCLAIMPSAIETRPARVRPAPTLPEHERLAEILAAGAPWLECRQVCEVTLPDGRCQAVPVITLGNPAPEMPAVGYFGGVHGLERIGSRVVLAFLQSLVARLAWDVGLRRQLDELRLVFMPFVNPGGMLLGTRANPQGVDLMRNAPVEAVEKTPFLVGGQRLSPGMPWYRGRSEAPMEVEAQALCQVVSEELLGRDFALALDCHSGFGANDRIWFPYAHTRQPIAHLAEVHALKEIFYQAHAQHRYLFEPQSRQYLAHGDLWDHLYRQSARQGRGVFLPLTLEMGSWLWVKKNPRQIFSRHGIFNPIKAHRHERVLRRHQTLLDFLARAACGFRFWLPQNAAREAHHAAALAQWY